MSNTTTALTVSVSTLTTEELASDSIRSAFEAGFSAGRGARCRFAKGSAEAMAFNSGRSYVRISKNLADAWEGFQAMESYWSKSITASLRAKASQGQVLVIG